MTLRKYLLRMLEKHNILDQTLSNCKWLEKKTDYVKRQMMLKRFAQNWKDENYLKLVTWLTDPEARDRLQYCLETSATRRMADVRQHLPGLITYRLRPFVARYKPNAKRQTERLYKTCLDQPAKPWLHVYLSKRTTNPPRFCCPRIRSNSRREKNDK